MTTQKKENKETMKTTVAKVQTSELNEPEVQFTKEQKTAYKSLLKTINTEDGKIAKSKMSIAVALWKIYNEKYFMIDGKRTIYEFASEKYDFSRGRTNECIGIVECFGEFAKDGDNNDKLVYTGNLLPDYQNYNYSQLVELMRMSEPCRLECNPDMSVRQLREKRRQYNDDNAIVDKTAEQKTLEDSATDEPIETEETEKEELLTKDELKGGEILIGEVDDIMHIDADEFDVIDMAFADFRRQYPDKKVKYRISLAWD